MVKQIFNNTYTSAAFGGVMPGNLVKITDVTKDSASSTVSQQP